MTPAPVIRHMTYRRIHGRNVATLGFPTCCGCEREFPSQDDADRHVTDCAEWQRWQREHQAVSAR